jgi:hypothetical protein
LSATHTSVVHENVDATVLRKHLIDRITDRSVVIHIERGHRQRGLSAETIFRSSPAPSMFRIVAITVCPPRASVTAVANPMPLLLPVTNAIAIAVSSDGYYISVHDPGTLPESFNVALI